jgi:hypothetical protein
MEPVSQPTAPADPRSVDAAANDHRFGHDDTTARRGISKGTHTLIGNHASKVRPAEHTAINLITSGHVFHENTKTRNQTTDLSVLSCFRGWLDRLTTCLARLGRTPPCAVVAAVVLWAVLSPTVVHGQPRDYDVKAVYLFNFGRFATWPDTVTAAEGPSINVCVIGRDPFGPSLDSTLAGETIQGKPIVARRITVAKDAAGCRILFVSASEEPRVANILDAIGRSGVLTVSDLPGFSARGGMIQFVVQENRVRFEVNLAAVEQANLKLSSELLKVATTVRRAGRPGS